MRRVRRTGPVRPSWQRLIKGEQHITLLGASRRAMNIKELMPLSTAT